MNENTMKRVATITVRTVAVTIPIRQELSHVQLKRECKVVVDLGKPHLPHIKLKTLQMNGQNRRKLTEGESLLRILLAEAFTCIVLIRALQQLTPSVLSKRFIDVSAAIDVKLYVVEILFTNALKIDMQTPIAPYDLLCTVSNEQISWYYYRINDFNFP